jgi:hypothetical protein
MNNEHMEIRGHVQNGVVVLEGGPALPEGAAVTVRFPATVESQSPVQKKRIQVPLVRTNEPGSVHLTGKRIGEILDDELLLPRH